MTTLGGSGEADTGGVWVAANNSIFVLLMINLELSIIPFCLNNLSLLSMRC